MHKRNELSHKKRVLAVTALYDECSRKHKGISNRDIWRRYIYPAYGITERTMYNLLKRSAEIEPETVQTESRIF